MDVGPVTNGDPSEAADHTMTGSVRPAMFTVAGLEPAGTRVTTASLVAFETATNATYCAPTGTEYVTATVPDACPATTEDSVGAAGAAPG